MRFHIILIITAEINPLHPHCPETSGRFFTLDAYTIRVESSKPFVRCSPLQITEKQSRPEEIHSEFPTPVFTIIQEMLAQIIVCRFAVDDDLVSDVVDHMHSVVLKNPKSHTSCWSHNHDIRCHEEGECRLQIIHFFVGAGEGWMQGLCVLFAVFIGFCTCVFGSSAVGFALEKIGKLRVLMQGVGELFVSSLVCMSFNADVKHIDTNIF